MCVRLVIGVNILINGKKKFEYVGGFRLGLSLLSTYLLLLLNKLKFGGNVDESKIKVVTGDR